MGLSTAFSHVSLSFTILLSSRVTLLFLRERGEGEIRAGASLRPWSRRVQEQTEEADVDEVMEVPVSGFSLSV